MQSSRQLNLSLPKLYPRSAARRGKRAGVLLDRMVRYKVGRGLQCDGVGSIPALAGTAGLLPLVLSAGKACGVAEPVLLPLQLPDLGELIHVLGQG